MKHLVIGLGTGRCGTRSFTKFLQEHGVKATHEKFRLFWEPDTQRWQNAISRMAENETADVGFYWLPYVEMTIERYPYAKIVCLKREKEKVIASYMRGMTDPLFCCLLWTRFAEESWFRLCDIVTEDELEKMDYGTREWVETYWEEDFKHETDGMKNHFPQYDLADKKSYLGQFWDEYYQKSHEFENKYPENFRVFDMEYLLNTEDGRIEVLQFIGVSPDTLMQ